MLELSADKPSDIELDVKKKQDVRWLAGLISFRVGNKWGLL